uniref:Reverse transcriptase (RNA-dependent DNA polymerase) n=1 Tax=Candidatus Kentrum sp. LFY TaxID=2126342 RepID=A0A450VBB1_9GAMM|nr:MAG: Reverse transcriptase (RNA-dependent DNA polymerase) [Candidatus Kentron sp. LFY]
MMDKVYSLKTLRIAWQLVWRNQGAAGIDHISIERFEGKSEQYLEELHESLKTQTYQPEAVKRVYIPKSDGKQRPLGIPTVKDRVVQSAVKIVIEPILLAYTRERISADELWIQAGKRL